MKITISKIATLVQGNFIGDADKLISGAAPFELAGENEITVAGSAKYLKKIGDCLLLRWTIPWWLLQKSCNIFIH